MCTGGQPSPHACDEARGVQLVYDRYQLRWPLGQELSLAVREGLAGSKQAAIDALQLSEAQAAETIERLSVCGDLFLQEVQPAQPGGSQGALHRGGRPTDSSGT